MIKLVFIIHFSLFVITCSFAQVSPSWISNGHFPEAGSSTATVVEVDLSGNVFSGGTAGINFVVKHDADGNVVWLQTYECGDTIAEAPNTLCLDNQGNAYITFMKHTPGGTYWSIAVQKYNASDGTILWTSELADSQFHGFEWQVKPTYMTMDDNFLYVAGTKFEPGVTGSEMLVMKLNLNGQILWDETIAGTGIYANAKSICVDQSGYVYIAGDAWNESIDYCVAKFDPDGNLVWDEFLDGDVYHNTDIAERVLVDDAGNVYICGITMKSCYSYTFVTIVKINPQGEVAWDVWVPNLYGIPWEIAVIDDDDLVVAAGAFDSIQVNDATTIRYQAATPPLYEADILDVYFESQVLPPEIDYENRRVIATVHDSANLATLIPFITRSEHSCMYPEDEIVTSFIEPVWYNITSFDEQTEKWWYLIVEGGYVGLEEHPAGLWKIYPNPTTGIFSLQFTVYNLKSVRVEVVDLYGKSMTIINNRTIEQLNSGTLELDISHLPAGIYFVMINLENQTIVKKIIKL